jgi:hypothetical protein
MRDACAHQAPADHRATKPELCRWGGFAEIQTYQTQIQLADPRSPHSRIAPASICPNPLGGGEANGWVWLDEVVACCLLMLIKNTTVSCNKQKVTHS